MTKTLLASAVLTATLAAVAPAHAATVVQWDFQTPFADLPDSATSPSVAASTGTGTAVGVHASAATDWSTPAGNGSSDSISANTWSVGDYWQFSFSTSGYTALMLSFDQTGSNTGPRDFQLAFSTDGSSFTDFGSPYALANAAWSAGLYNPASTYTFDLSTVSALDNQASVFVRLIDSSTVAINGGTVAAGGTSRIDNFTVNLTPVPEPATWALMCGGIAAVARIARRRS